MTRGDFSAATSAGGSTARTGASGPSPNPNGTSARHFTMRCAGKPDEKEVETARCVFMGLKRGCKEAGGGVHQYLGGRDSFIIERGTRSESRGRPRFSALVSTGKRHVFCSLRRAFLHSGSAPRRRLLNPGRPPMSRTWLSVITALGIVATSITIFLVRRSALGPEIAGPLGWQVTVVVEGTLQTTHASVSVYRPLDF